MLFNNIDFDVFFKNARLQALLVSFANAKPITKPITGFVIE